MFGDININVEQIRLENPTIKKNNKIDIEAFAPKVAVVEQKKEKKKKGQRVASLESETDESEDPIAKAAAEAERVK